MSLELYRKYGNYNKDRYFILDHEKWHYYAERPKIYKRNKIIAYLWLLVPIAGIVGYSEVFNDMGLCGID